MSNSLTNPLQAMIKKSASVLPATTGTVARYAERLNRLDGPQIIIADVSGSMDGPAWGRRCKLDLLRDAVDAILSQAGEPMHLIAFAGTPADGICSVPADTMPGGTAMHLALECAARHHPRATLVISDGQPDDEATAIAAAHRLTGRIDVLYIGPDIERAAIQFMRRLAEVGCGQYSNNDISRVGQPTLTHSIQQLLIGSGK